MRTNEHAKALENAGQETEIRQELSIAVGQLFNGYKVVRWHT